MLRMRGTALVLTALVAGCGGSGTVSHSVPSARVQTASVAFHIEPSKAPSSSKRSPRYVSAGTQSARVDVSSPGLPSTTTLIRCSFGACSKSIDVPVATDTFTVTLYDGYNADGNVLSAGKTTQTIIANQANAVNVTFDAAPVHVIALSFGPPNALIGAPSQTTVNIAAVDAAGYTIVGPGAYDPPIKLTLTDSSGSTSLSETTVTSPNDDVKIAYNGTPKISATLTAVVQGDTVQQTRVFEPANVTKEYALQNSDGSQKTIAPRDIAQGADGALWFAEGSDAKIGRISATGATAEYAISSIPTRIVAGPDGALWFGEMGPGPQYGRIATDGSVTEFAIAASGAAAVDPAGLAFGADGNLYVADAGNPAVYAVTPATGALVRTYALATNANAVVTGPDNNIWVGTAGAVARIRLSDGLVSAFATSGAVTSLTAGSDGNVWFTDRAGKVGNVTPAGAVTEFAIPTYGDNAYKIVAAPDGTYWFTYGHVPPADETLCRIGHATATGSITSYAIADCNTTSLAFGPDHNLWLTEFTRSRIGIFSSF
ncbi:MAG TPA: hypothetical protein VGD01_17620 [Candidatus Elarobacter sp.]|jgi:virginiamycin B lyase